MTSAYMGFLPTMYIYGIYRHVPSYWNDSMRFRIIVYMQVTMATGSIIIYTPHMPRQHVHIHTNFNNDIYARLALTNCILKQLTHNTHLYIAVYWLKGKLAYTWLLKFIYVAGAFRNGKLCRIMKFSQEVVKYGR